MRSPNIRRRRDFHSKPRGFDSTKLAGNRKGPQPIWLRAFLVFVPSAYMPGSEGFFGLALMRIRLCFL